MPYGTIKIDTITFTDGGVDKSVPVSGLVLNPTFTGNVTVTGTISGNTIQGGTIVSGLTVTGTTANFASGVFSTQVSGVTITGTTVAATTGTFTSLTGTTTNGTTASFTTGNFTSLTGTTTTGTTANFASGVFTTQVSGLLITGPTVSATTGTFTSLTGTTTTGTTANFVSGVFTTQISGVTITGTTVSTTTGTFVSLTGTTATFTSGIIASGTAALPSLAILSDSDTGIYSPGANQLAISTNGAGRLFITSAGLIGIGQSSPGSALDVAGEIRIYPTSGAANLRFGSGGAEKGKVAIDSSSNYTVETAGSERLRITSAGLVGIGTSSPSSLLHLSVATAASDGTKGVRITNPVGTAAMFECGSSNDSYVGTTSASHFSIRTNNTSRIYVTDGGNVGIGTTSPDFPLQVGATGSNGIAFDSTNSIIHGTFGSGGGLSLRAQLLATAGGGDIFLGGSSRGDANVNSIVFSTANTARAKIDSSGYFTVSSNRINGFEFDHANGAIYNSFGTGGALALRAQTIASAGGGQIFLGGSSRGDGDVNAIVFSNANTERARIDSSGRLLVGTSSARGYGDGNIPFVQVERATIGGDIANIGVCNNGDNGAGPKFTLAKSRSGSNGGVTVVQNGDSLGSIQWSGADGTDIESVAAQITCNVDGTPGANDMPGRLVFSTTADGASSPTRRVVMRNNGWVVFGQDTENSNAVGIGMYTTGGEMYVNSFDSTTLQVNRISTDGTLISFKHANTEEGSISVFGTTVSYNGAHLSRWSQLPGGAARKEILRGTILSNIDEMCEWGKEDNEQLNRMKVSDVEGDTNVSGVFQAWDDDDDTYDHDFYCAMTGDFIIRIAAGVTVERGDLLMSAGDGTAKPQDDDIIRSKTIAKVTSTHITCTYEDGSYCMPCVLMAC